MRWQARTPVVAVRVAAPTASARRLHKMSSLRRASRSDYPRWNGPLRRRDRQGMLPRTHTGRDIDQLGYLISAMDLIEGFAIADAEQIEDAVQSHR